MKLSNINNFQTFNSYSRLSMDDISRIPTAKILPQDSLSISTTNSHKSSKSNAWRNVFTAATFGLTALCIAYQKNLFNPIKREAISLVKSDELKEKVQKFIVGKINENTYDKLTKKYLEEFIENEKSPEDMVKQANILLKDNDKLSELYKKVHEALNDETPQENLENGYVVSLLDKFKDRIETYLIRNKQNDVPYKNQANNIINDFFTPQKGQPSVADTLLENTVMERSQNTIDSFLKDMVDAAEYGIENSN